MADPGIVRNRLKIDAAIRNAQAFLKVQKEYGSFHHYVWSFVDGQPIQTNRNGSKDIPVRTAESDAVSKDLAKRGFSFVGSTICYALMQATGMVNAHILDCFRHAELAERR